jgi:hypothetical protein
LFDISHLKHVFARLYWARNACQKSGCSVLLIRIGHFTLLHRFVLLPCVKGAFQINRLLGALTKTAEPSGPFHGHDVCEGRKALNGSGPPEAKGG